MIDVFAVSDEKWNHLIKTAFDRSLEAKETHRYTTRDGREYLRGEATSNTDPSKRYQEVVLCDADGVHVLCNCDAGKFDTPCTHAALFLLEADYWWATL